MRPYPFLNPNASNRNESHHSTPYNSKLTAQQQFNKIVQQVMFSKNRLNQAKNIIQQQSKCKLHPVRPSKMCRQCKQTSKVSQQSTQVKKTIVIQQKQTLEQKINQNMFNLNTDNPLTHINQKLKTNIQNSHYFKGLYELRTFTQVVKEIEQQCRCVQTFQKGSSENPTKFICLFYKTLLMRLTKNQVFALTKNKNVFVKALGLLYIRMVGKYQDLWNNLESFLNDKSDIYTKFDQTQKLSIGQYTHNLLTQLNHYQLRLPRIPILVQKQIQSYLNQRSSISSKKILISQQQTNSQKKVHKQQLKSNLKLLAVAIKNGKKYKYPVFQLAPTKVIAIDFNNQLIEFDYEDVNLEDNIEEDMNKNDNTDKQKKSPLKQKIQKSKSKKKFQSPKRKSRKSRSRSRSFKKYRDRRRSKQRSRDKRRRRKYSSSQSSSSSNSSSSLSSSSSNSSSSDINSSQSISQRQIPNKHKNKTITTQAGQYSKPSLSLQSIKANISKLSKNLQPKQ